jgi:hypothetical protein
MFNSKSIHYTQRGKFNAEKYVSTFYDDKGGEKQGIDYLFNGGEIACRVNELREMTQEEYDILSKFI